MFIILENDKPLHYNKYIFLKRNICIYQIRKQELTNIQTDIKIKTLKPTSRTSVPKTKSV